MRRQVPELYANTHASLGSVCTQYLYTYTPYYNTGAACRKSEPMTSEWSDRGLNEPVIRNALNSCTYIIYTHLLCDIQPFGGESLISLSQFTLYLTVITTENSIFKVPRSNYTGHFTRESKSVGISQGYCGSLTHLKLFH
ncbi:uncharacterized protein LOC115033854 [Acyrthosiphon pisum]|uniref:Uncharacterized protein n=1 Tax=Acyrthosiphon pisum TaxID=7029 RepID=A0A8R2NQX9_ACYPI|nr:uncharacterized protein LOC115033854 [Acyrthosiphon pisum]